MASKKAKRSPRTSAKRSKKTAKQPAKKAAKSTNEAPAKSVKKAAKTNKAPAKPVKKAATAPAKKVSAVAPVKVKVGGKPKPKSKAAAQRSTPERATSQGASMKKSAKAESSNGKRVDVGDTAPSFELTDDSGATLSSDSLRGAPYVLYFYPKDDTTGCTLQACGFRDALPRFGAKRVKVLGVSPDSVASHERFKQKYGLTFPLLADPEKSLAKAYGVWVMKQNYGREYMGIERSTFLVDEKGTIKQAWRGVRVPGHIDKVFDAL